MKILADHDDWRKRRNWRRPHSYTSKRGKWTGIYIGPLVWYVFWDAVS